MQPGLARFIPPHCPRSDCAAHHYRVGWRWVRCGTYARQCHPQIIPRYRCGQCRRTFSFQSFSATYYLKRPALLEPIFHRLLACSGYRQIAREAGCHPTTVMGQAARLGRHALLHLHAHRPHGPLAEPLVIDGFESFAYSQYHPIHLNFAVGARSHYVYGFTYAELRRKGRMTAVQRRRRAQLEARHGRPDPAGLERSVETLLRLAVHQRQSLELHSDEHPAYPRALRRLAGWSIEHHRISSLAARTPQNPLFPINLLDLLLRHNSANHKRETIAFSKRGQSAVERAALLMVWRNDMKRFSERHGGSTPAMRLGLRERPLRVKQWLRRRLFPALVRLPAEWMRYYQRLVPTAEISSPRRHALKLAF